MEQQDHIWKLVVLTLLLSSLQPISTTPISSPVRKVLYVTNRGAVTKQQTAPAAARLEFKDLMEK